ncbi:unnamed protein product [Moneuplotes crassus]|uniref:Thioesterase domain-containing protein n=1 Tax=Euplotes crassus TaxID=5936 RepID=A0AAD1Y0R2_EUPCR|nr:unnamed protein product [Moneuplotes crassus]
MNPALLKRTNRLMHLFQKSDLHSGTYARPLYELIELVGIDEKAKTVIFESPVTEFQTNNIGSVHGGCLMTYIDIVTTIGIYTFSRDDKATTSANITTDFMAPGELGTTLSLVAKMDKIGKRLAFSSAEIYSKESNQLVAKGSHIKAFLPMDFKGIKDLKDEDFLI